MSTPTRLRPPDPGTLKPSSLADTQIDHIERMVRAVLRGSVADIVSGMDPQYWKSRVHALVKETNLVAVQQQRVKRLLDEIDYKTRSKPQKRTAA